MPVNRRNALRGGALAAASTVFLTRPAFASAAPSAAPAASGVPTATAPIVAAYRQLQTGINRPSPERTEALANLGRVAKAYNASMSVAGGGAPLWTDLPLGPGSGVAHFTLSLVQLSGKPLASVEPLKLGPRHCGQFSA